MPNNLTIIYTLLLANIDLYTCWPIISEQWITKESHIVCGRPEQNAALPLTLGKANRKSFNELWAFNRKTNSKRKSICVNFLHCKQKILFYTNILISHFNWLKSNRIIIIIVGWDMILMYNNQCVQVAFLNAKFCNLCTNEILIVCTNISVTTISII